MTLHEDVADGIGSEGTGSNVALGFTFDADITWSWHGYAPDWLNGNDTRPNPLAVTMPNNFLFKKQIIKASPYLFRRHTAQQVA
ncbi:hypothetical protein ACM3N2_23490 [Aeromonas hydrophila]|uniref:hypothetical protein n=1 Tax=Aeromonas hydrophila TaxID=644 RepID=UPI0039F72E4C